MMVEEIMELTSQKRETIEHFRIKLLEYGLIGLNKYLDQRAVTTFRKAVEYWEAAGSNEAKQNVWSDSIQRAIQEEYGEEMVLPFTWNNDSLIKHLIWKIKNGRVNVVPYYEMRVNGHRHSEEISVMYQIIMDNFQEIGKCTDVYNNSFGTDGNPQLTYICEGEDYIYYIIGKYNRFTKQEDVHVFYNDGIEFNLMRCKHVCGGYSEKGRLKELLETCSSHAPKQ